MNNNDSMVMPTELVEGHEIRTKPEPRCALCGSEGKVMYEQQRDRLFSAPGSWTIKRCSNLECGVIWPDPMPIEADIYKAYTNYYTHASSKQGKRFAWLRAFYQQMKRGYWSGKYGYCIPSVNSVHVALGKLLYLLPLRRREVDECVRYLPALPQGKLLDVGCGSGEWLLTMRELGWQVDGVDFDDNAVKVARQKGLNVACGDLHQQNYLNDQFDAITLNHVIEHVPDPIRTLVECRRILKPGGKLAIFTPNGASLSHRLFKQDWRGLETPRHLHVYSNDSLLRLLQQAGFSQVVIHPQIAYSVIYESTLLQHGWTGQELKRGRRWYASACARVFNLWELCRFRFDPSVADCVGSIATK